MKNYFGDIQLWTKDTYTLSWNKVLSHRLLLIASMFVRFLLTFLLFLIPVFLKQFACVPMEKYPNVEQFSVGSFTHSSWENTGINVPAPLVIFTIHTCSYIQDHFRLAPFHTCHSNARMDGARTVVQQMAVGAHWEMPWSHLQYTRDSTHLLASSNYSRSQDPLWPSHFLSYNDKSAIR